MGQVLTAGAGQNPARQASIKAGLPFAVPAMTLNKVCGSGLKALHLGAQAIRCGDADVIIAGGQENMSLSNYVMPGARTGLRMGNAQLVDTMISDGLWDAFNDYHMGITAENLAEKYSLTREQQDAFAAASQQKATAAIEGGRFVDEITPILIPQRKGDPLSFATDEQPRAGTTAESLGKLKPAFKKDGSVTAGNASSLNDGAARGDPDERREGQGPGPAGTGENRGLRQRWRGPGDHGHRPGVGHPSLPGQGRLVHRSTGPDRSQRSLPPHNRWL